MKGSIEVGGGVKGSTEVGVEWGEGQHRSWSGVRAAQKWEWGEGSTEVGVG